MSATVSYTTILQSGERIEMELENSADPEYLIDIGIFPDQLLVEIFCIFNLPVQYETDQKRALFALEIEERVCND